MTTALLVPSSFLLRIFERSFSIDSRRVSLSWRGLSMMGSRGKGTGHAGEGIGAGR
jgi:hypothetical protein